MDSKVVGPDKASSEFTRQQSKPSSIIDSSKHSTTKDKSLSRHESSERHRESSERRSSEYRSDYHSFEPSYEREDKHCAEDYDCKRTVIVKVEGPRGKRGFQGNDGKIGPQGYRGHPGCEGPQGYDGKRGHQGRQGYQGHQGVDGVQGCRGCQGHQGYQGHKGCPGPQIYSGEGPPETQSLCVSVGDLYLDLKSGILYRLISSCPPIWQPIAVLKGPQGPQGFQGAPGGFGGIDCTATAGVNELNVNVMDTCPVGGNFIHSRRTVSIAKSTFSGTGDDSTPDTSIPRIPRRVMYHYHPKSAFRAGYVPEDSNRWQPQLDTVGEFSVGFNFNTLASGSNSLAAGEETEATQRNAASFGFRAKATGLNSFAHGFEAAASGDHSFSTGEGPIASGSSSLASGFLTVASGNHSISTGSRSESAGIGSVAHGFQCRSIGEYSFSTGDNTTSMGRASLALGFVTTANGNHSLATGSRTQAVGVGSFASGFETKAVGEYSFSAGANNVSIGLNSVSFGFRNQSTGDWSLTAGRDNIAGHEGGMALGIGLRTNTAGGTIVGRYNDSSCGDHLFGVGCGTDDEHRSNAMTVNSDCTTTFYNLVTFLGGAKFCGPITFDSLTTRGKITTAELKTNTLTSNSSSLGTATASSLTTTGGVNVGGTLTKTTGTFKIDHPDPKKNKTHNLYHSFVESPTAGDNIYRFAIKLEAMKELVFPLPDYYNHLNQNSQVWLNSTDTFGRAKGKVVKNNLILMADTTDTYNILVIGTRKDMDAVKNWPGVEVAKI